MPNFQGESDEADWWASRAGREYLKRKSTAARSAGIKAAGSELVAKLNKNSSVQIALRLPKGDVERARKLAERKGIG